MITLTPSGRHAPQTVRAGGGSGKNRAYTSFMLDASSMLWRSTFTFTTRSSEEPAVSKSCRRLTRICWVSLAVVPGLRSPVCGSVAVSPDTKMNAPPRTAIEATAAGAGLGAAAGGEMISRFAAITYRSRGGNHVQLDFEACL